MSPSDALLIGTDPGDLTVKVVKGRPWVGSSVLCEELPDESLEVIAWDAPPILEFDGGLTVSAVLSTDPETSTPNSVATWSMTGDQTETLRTGLEVFLTVNGEDWYMGEVKCRS